MNYENTDLFSFYLPFFLFFIFYICDNCCLYPKTLTYFVCLFMPLDRVWKVRRKKLTRTRKQRCIFCRSIHICSLYQHVFYVKMYCHKVSCYLSDLIHYAEEKIYEKVNMHYHFMGIFLVCWYLFISFPKLFAY
jgi:hypothetical protein